MKWLRLRRRPRFAQGGVIKPRNDDRGTTPVVLSDGDCPAALTPEMSADLQTLLERLNQPHLTRLARLQAALQPPRRKDAEQ